MSTVTDHQPTGPGIKKKISSILMTLFLICLLIFIFLTFFLFESHVINSNSMEPALKHGDYILTRKTDPGEKYSFKRGEIVVLQLPGERDIIVKRIVGLPGETVTFRDGGVFVDNALLEEPYLAIDEKIQYKSLVYTIPENAVLVLGDNRLPSRDSREFGPVGTKDIREKVLLRYYPFNRMKCFIK